MQQPRPKFDPGSTISFSLSITYIRYWQDLASIENRKKGRARLVRIELNKRNITQHAPHFNLIYLFKVRDIEIPLIRSETMKSSLADPIWNEKSIHQHTSNEIKILDKEEH